jgi:glutamate decarboxylase
VSLAPHLPADFCRASKAADMNDRPQRLFQLKDGLSPGFTLYDLSERVRIRGWLIASYPLPARRESVIVQRIVIRHGVSRDLTQLLLVDLRHALNHLQANPVPHSTAGPTFHH